MILTKVVLHQRKNESKIIILSRLRIEQGVKKYSSIYKGARLLCKDKRALKKYVDRQDKVER